MKRHITGIRIRSTFELDDVEFQRFFEDALSLGICVNNEETKRYSRIMRFHNL